MQRAPAQILPIAYDFRNCRTECALVHSLLFSLTLVSPILAIPITDQFLNDRLVRGYFADVLRQGGYGHWHTERAAFIVRDESGEYRCVAWPLDGGFRRQQFDG